jgi:hypothetical protein
MEKYIIPRNKRRHLVVSDSVHEAVRAYATGRELSLVEATYRLLKLGFIQELELPVPDDEVDKYEIKKPPALDFRRWFRRR